MSLYKFPFPQRKIVGNKAEEHFKKICKEKNVFYKPFGIEKAKYNQNDHKYLDYRLQCQPDYVIYSNNDLKYIEVKCTLKFKEYDLESYKHWNVFNKLYFFISYNNFKEWQTISFDDLYKLIKNKKKKYYPDNNKIYSEFTLQELKNYKL